MGKEVLSIFCDESGDFDVESKHSPYYLLTLVFHDQSSPIDSEIRVMEKHLNNDQVQKHAIHSAPLIRREPPYENMRIDERRVLFNQLFYFTAHCDIRYRTFIFEKNLYHNKAALIERMRKELYQFMQSNLLFFNSFDTIKVYYDNGQTEITQTLQSILNSLFKNVEYKRVLPIDYRLFQVADLICTVELLALKREKKELSSSEKHFFYKSQELKKTYINGIRKKKYK